MPKFRYIFGGFLNRKIILVFLRYYLPGSKAGGPIRSISNLVNKFSNDFDFRIVTSDRDMLDGAPYKNIDVDTWNKVGKACVFYASPGSLGVNSIISLIKKTSPDKLYLNSFFDPIFTGRVLFACWLENIDWKSVVIAPRGEFSKGALKFNYKRKWI